MIFTFHFVKYINKYKIWEEKALRVKQKEKISNIFGKIMKKYKEMPLICEFLITTIAIFGFNLYMGIGYESYFYDCSGYRTYGNELFQNGEYNLLNISDGFRGYIFPTLLGFSEVLDSLIGIDFQPICFKLFTSIITGYFFTWSIPKLVRDLFGCNKVIKRYKKIFNLLLIMIFFWGLFIYPLTDMLAMFLCINAVICIISAMNTESIIKKIVLFALSGILLYASYNVRSIYIFSVIMGFLMIMALSARREGKRGIVYVLSFLLGIFLCSVPQIIINYHTLKKVSIMLPTNSLMVQQLEWGMYYQRYETYVGNVYNSPKLIFQDKSGLKILEIVGNIESIKDYVLACLRYPFDFIGIYTRHIFNMFCPIYPEQYIFDLEKNRSGLFILNYSMLYVFVFWCTTNVKQNMANLVRKMNIDGLMVFFILLLPSVFIMPGAVEQRFSITIYVLICSYMTYCIDYKLLIATIQEKWIECALTFVIGLCIALAIWGNTLSNLTISNLIIGY